ncbi:MAG: aldehyde dehydrogenase [Planctomycetota bacterium]|nr:aldehyde dehydrogenase [Planctomycetota bacterium]
MLVFENFIAGRHVAARSGATLDVIEPATGRAYARVSDSDAADVDDAVTAAESAFPAWRALPTAERARLLSTLADLIERDLEPLARAESVDSGKPLSVARSVDIPRAATNFRFFAGAAMHSSSEMHETDSGATGGRMVGRVHAINYTQRSPLGVAGLISPWNLPLYLLTWKIAPALAVGNCVVAKPSEVTPATATMLASLASQAGFPPGVINIVHGRGRPCGSAIVTHPRISVLSFTGSTPVGRWIAEAAGAKLKRVSLELGGKNPFIVFPDADLDTAHATALRAAFSNQGQICLCGSRILVHRSIFSSFLDRFVAAARAIRMGDPLDPSTQHGALVSEPHLEKVHALVRAARDLGGRIHCGGERPSLDALAKWGVPERCHGGFFYPPTVIDGLDPSCRVEQEEIFGPVVTLQPFDDEDHALALANGTPYGLAATLFTQDLSRAHRVASKLEAGLVWVNCWMLRDLRTPMGGFKQSGVGREGGRHALEFFTEAKNVCIQIA